MEFPWDIEKKHLFSCAGFAVIGVALMVGILFFLMIAVERTFEWLGNQISKIFGFRKKSKDPEDPAALVGSFKRYKNWTMIISSKKSAFKIAPSAAPSNSYFCI